MGFLTVKVGFDDKFYIIQKELRHAVVFLACGCSTSGSSTTSCSSSGTCTCKSNFSGSKCTSCKAGFYDYPNCYCKEK